MFTNFVFFCFSGRDNINIYACDCSNEALERANKMIEVSNVGSVAHHSHLFHCDFSTNGFPKWLACDSCQGNFLQKQHDQFLGLRLCIIHLKKILAFQVTHLCSYTCEVCNLNSICVCFPRC